MRYFKIEGIVEIDDSKFSEESKENFLNNFIEEFLNEFCYPLHSTFGVGIKEVDENGEDL